MNALNQLNQSNYLTALGELEMFSSNVNHLHIQGNTNVDQ
jgi:hypothetical protein